MASKPVLLLLGYGANIGHAAAKKFEAGGYRVAIAARSLSEEKVSDQRWSYPINLTHPNAVTDLFAKATRDIGIPSVVIYNGNAVASYYFHSIQLTCTSSLALKLPPPPLSLKIVPSRPP